VGCLFGNFSTGRAFNNFFQNGWGLPWRMGDYHRTTHYLNADMIPRMDLKDATKLAESFSMKAIHVSGVAREHVLYAPSKDSRLESMVWAPTPIKDQGPALRTGTKVEVKVGLGKDV